MTPRLIVNGAGDVGGRVASLWVERGGEAIGITQSERRHSELAHAGVAPRSQPWTPNVRPSDVFVFSVAGSSKQKEALKCITGQGPLPNRAVFLSTVGFYGSQSGLLGPHVKAGTNARASEAAQAEAAFRSRFPNGSIIRLGGLYRRGRGPQEALRRRGHPPDVLMHDTMGLIHVDDAVVAIINALLLPDSPGLFVGVVSQPSRQDYYREACDILGLATPSSSERRTSRSYDSSGFRETLLPSPRWPDWRAGLRHALSADSLQ